MANVMWAHSDAGSRVIQTHGVALRKGCMLSSLMVSPDGPLSQANIHRPLLLGLRERDTDEAQHQEKRRMLRNSRNRHRPAVNRMSQNVVPIILPLGMMHDMNQCKMATYGWWASTKGHVDNDWSLLAMGWQSHLRIHLNAGQVRSRCGRHKHSYTC